MDLHLFSIRRGVPTLLTVVLLGCAHGMVAADDGASGARDCLRVQLEPPPVWAFRGSWLGGGDRLVVADAGAGVLRLYDRAGRPLATVAHPGHGPLEFNRPSRIWPVAGGALLQDGSRFLWLNDDLTPTRSYDMNDVPVAPRGTVRALFESAATPDWIFGIGDALLPDETWRRGFHSMPLEDPADYALLREVPVRDRDEFDHYLMGYQHVATLDGRGFFLSMEAPPRILAVDKGDELRRLEAFPEGYAVRPALPLHTGLTGAEVRYRAYESPRLPVGLYGRGGRLFVLTREPIPAGDGGGTRWTLTRIDPRADRIDGAVILPTRAAHLTVIPGPERWAVLEKGRVERYGVQPISSMLLVPSAWIEADGSPLAASAPKEDLCEAR